MEWSLKPIRVGSMIEVDPASGRYRGPNGASGRLTPLERTMLVVLLAHRGAIVSRETLFAAAHEGEVADARGLRAVDQAVSRLRRRVFPDHGVIVGVRGKGYRIELGEPAHAPAPASVGLVGRVAELALLESELAATRRPSRHVELVGAGGIGKSTLARAVLARAEARGEAVAWVALDGVADRDGVLARACEALGLRSDAESDTAQLLAGLDARLAAQPRMLLVLDDIDLAADPLSDLARALPSLRATRVLWTARRSRAAEWAKVGATLTTLAVTPLPFDDALALVSARASERRDRPPTDAERDAEAELARALGGWPLALELAVARGLPPRATTTAPTKTETGELERELEAMLAAMWTLVPRGERRLLRFVALARGTLPSRLFADGDSEAETSAGLAALQRSGWLGRRTEGRVELHALVRDFVLTRVTTADRRAFVEHLAAHAAALVRGPITMDSRAMTQLAQLAPAIDVALALPEAEPRDGVRAALLSALGRHHHLQGPLERAVAVAERLREHLAAAPATPDARALHTMRALLLLGARDGDGGRADARAALALAQRPTDRMDALGLLARTHRNEPAVAEPALREAIALASDALERARAESVLAAWLAREERFDEALPPMLRACEALELAAVPTRFAEDNFLAFVLAECGLPSQATRIARAAEEAYLALARRPVRPGFVAVAALLATARGEIDEAARLLDQVIAHGSEFGRPVLGAQASVWRIVCEVLAGRVDAARARAGAPFAELDGARTDAAARAYAALEAADRGLLHGLRALLASDLHERAAELAAAREALGDRFPSTRWLVDTIAGTAGAGLAPTGLRARLAPTLVARAYAAPDTNRD